MAEPAHTTIRELLLVRRGLVFVSSRGEPLADEVVRAVELELAAVGYVVSARLRARLASASLDELAALRTWLVAKLLARVGGDREHTPLFQSFPEGIPKDTQALWWDKVLVHFLGAPEQPCPLCRQTGTTHVLSPCRHVVCTRCFDGASYSACPVCEHHVDRSSPFFQPAPDRDVPREIVRYQLLDWGEDLDSEARALFSSLCLRTQALSPDDRDALLTVVREARLNVLGWLPKAIPVRENVASIFGTLFSECAPELVLPFAKQHMTTATDVLRFIAVLSGADGSLLPETVLVPVTGPDPAHRFWDRVAKYFGVELERASRTVYVGVKGCRFKVAKLSRPLRRALLSVLEGFPPERAIEDMLRHRSYWVWVGEFLHPHEHAARYPNVARAFRILRQRAPNGDPEPRPQTWHSKVEACVRARTPEALVALLAERPGELARRLDHALRLCENGEQRERVVATFTDSVPRLATPVLLTLASHLPRRAERAPVRVYFPKSRVGLGVAEPDARSLLAMDSIEPCVRAINAELLRRFSLLPHFGEAVIDEALRTVVVPFNERVASRAAVTLPRGTRVPVQPSKLVRLFLHWCEPARDADTTDLDLSVGLYDESWSYVGVCSYYELEAKSAAGVVLARSAGDLRSAPYPDGATEFVDLYQAPARQAGVRFAVMVVNAYSGMTFGQLERAFAGLNLRGDASGTIFDPRTVELKFSLSGEHGIYVPLVLDLEEGVLHWLDAHSKGHLAMNNVATSSKAITRICPDLMSYFGSGVRASMLDLALLHAAARCRRVFLRGQAVAELVRRSDESVAEFHARLVRRDADEPRSRLPIVCSEPQLAFLFRGDMPLSEGSRAYALFREQLTQTLSAADLLTTP